MKIYLKNKKCSYCAEAIWDGGRDVVVLKGSKISDRLVENFKFATTAIISREDKSIVDKNYTVLKDTHFRSLTTAAQFVTGRSINGRDCWKNKDDISLKHVIRGK